MNAPSPDDLSRLRAIAEECRRTPLLGGWHLILWGCAMSLALLIDWAVLRRILPLPGEALAISWFGIVAAAWAGSILLGRSKASEPGAFSVGNRVERAVWMTAGAFLFVLSAALVGRASLGGERADWSLLAIMSPAMFGAYAIALQASAVAGGTGARPFVVVSLAFAAATGFMIGDPNQSLLAAAGVALVSIPAGLRHLSAARRAG